MNATKKLRRRAAVVVLLAVPALASCSSTNFDAQTDQYYTPTDGDNAREGTVDVLHALIVSEEPGTGRLIAGLAHQGTAGDRPLGMEASGPEQESQSQDGEEATLTGVRGLDESQDVQFSIVEGETAVPPGQLLQLADEGSAVIAVSGDPEQVAPGKYVRLAFVFENGEEIELNVPVFPPGTDYADIELPSPGVGTAELTSSAG